MSLELTLIPQMLAVITASAGAGSAAVGQTLDEARAANAVAVRTRMKDVTLLKLALADVGGTQVQDVDGGVRTTIRDQSLTLVRGDDGIWTVHLESADGSTPDREAALELIAELDVAYAARVQAAVAQRIRERAHDAGFELVSETRDDDDTVTMLLNVRNRG
jgi:hypothetical protein